MIYQVVQLVTGGITVENRDKGILPVDFTNNLNESMFVMANSYEEALEIFNNAGKEVENFDYVCECCTFSDRWELILLEDFDIDNYKNDTVVIHSRNGFTVINRS
jgi:hypothetical protein